MKRNYLISLFCLCWLSITGVAQENVSKIYSATLHELNGHAPSFVLSDNSFEPTFLGAIDSKDVTVTMPCGANCNGTYYGFLAKEGVPYKLVTVDWTAAKTTDVVSFDSDYPAFFDMAYNFHTGKVYAALNNADENTVLYEMNVGDGTYLKVADLGVKARAIDFRFDGTLYALTTQEYDAGGYMVNALTLASYDSDFTLKESKLVFDDWSSYIGVYENDTYIAFSMEFDHLSGVLYYTQTNSQQQYAYTLDVKEGKRLTGSIMLGSDPTYTQNFDALSLYIPFIAPDGGGNSAAPVTDYQATADAGGALKATLTWKNPTVNFANEPLAELYSIRIYRESVSDENLLTEIKENVAVGGEMSWTDENGSQGNNTYVLVPCRVVGEKGVATTVSVFAGFDVPGHVESIILEMVPEGIKVSWQKPTTTQNGGVLDENTLKYTVVRMPDELPVKTDVTETSFVDTNPLSEWKEYSYMITAKTAAGESEPFDGWTRIYAGPALTAPYETTFDNEKANGLWKSSNENKDGFEGYFDSYSGMFTISAVYYEEDAIKNLNTWLISPAIKLTPGQYKITVESYINKADFANSFDIAYGTEQTVEAQSNNLGSFSYSSTADAQTDLAETLVNIPADGSYNFSVHMTAAKIFQEYERCALGISFFKIEYVGEIPPPEEDFKVTGTVVDDKESAVQGAKVTVTHGGKTFEAETSATGEFTVDVTGIHDAYDVTVEKEGFNAVAKQFTYAGEDVVDLGRVVLTPVEEDFKVTGTVVDDKEAVIQGAKVTITHGDKTFEAETGATGEFTVDVTGIRDAYDMTISKTGYDTVTDQFTYAGEDVDLGSVTLTPAEEDFKVTGTVVDDKETAIPGAKVTVTHGDKTFEAETSATGEFTVDVTGIRDTYDMTIAKESFNAVTDQFIYAGEDVNLGNVVLTPIPDGINNIIYDADGNAEIKIYDLSGRFIKTMTISKGEKLNLERGIYIINGVKHAVE